MADIWMFDYFPIVSDHFPNTKLPIERRKDLFYPPVYDCRRIPKSRLCTVQVPSNKISVTTYNGYMLPKEAQLHSKGLKASSNHPATLIVTTAHQFNLTGGDGMKTELMVLIRRGAEIMMLGEVWRLICVVFKEDSTCLYYHPVWRFPLVPVIMEISQCKPEGLNFVGDYRA
jgi:hypothetical protein